MADDIAYWLRSRLTKLSLYRVRLFAYLVPGMRLMHLSAGPARWAHDPLRSTRVGICCEDFCMQAYVNAMRTVSLAFAGS